MNLSATIRDVLSRAPEAAAVEYAGRWYPWRYLARVAARLDELLTAAGLDRGAAIGLVSRNKPAHAGALLGLLARERCAVMIHAAQSEQGLARELRALRLPALLADARDWTPVLRAAAREQATLAIALDADAAEPIALLSEPGTLGPGPYKRVDPDVIAELLSSGTTSAPKRIGLRRATFEAACADATAVYAPGRLDAVPHPGIVFQPLGNISGITFLIPLALQGHRLALLEKFELEVWLDAVQRHQPARTSLPPAALRMILDAAVPRGALQGVATIGVGGARLDPELQDAFESRYGIPLLQAYGATEFCGVIASWTHELYREYRTQKRGSVGRPRPGVEVRAVDADSGRVLAAGNIGVLEARIERIGPEWIRTTDLASLDADGFVYIHGRADQAINRGGFKIAPEEVAAALREHPLVADAAVLGMPDARLGELPVAALELRSGTPPALAELERHARERLLAYQVPGRFIVLRALPRTQTMKVDLPALRRLLEPLLEGEHEGTRVVGTAIVTRVTLR